MWTMRCLLCPPADQIGWGADLVRLQEHAMYDHGYSRVDLRNNTRRPGSRSRDHYIWPHRAEIALRGGTGLGLRLAKPSRYREVSKG